MHWNVHWKQTWILLCEYDRGIGVISFSWVNKQDELICSQWGTWKMWSLHSTGKSGWQKDFENLQPTAWHWNKPTWSYVLSHRQAPSNTAGPATRGRAHMRTFTGHQMWLEGTVVHQLHCVILTHVKIYLPSPIVYFDFTLCWFPHDSDVFLISMLSSSLQWQLGIYFSLTSMQELS